jgi:hypothetical protein
VTFVAPAAEFDTAQPAFVSEPPEIATGEVTPVSTGVSPTLVAICEV